MIHIHDQLERLPLSALTPYASNSRTHSEEQIEQIAASMREFGFTNPVLVDETGGIVAGHGRVLAARLLGLAEVPCLRLEGLTAAQRRAYVIADNQIALNAGWNEVTLRTELQALQGMDFNLGLLGFDPDALDALLTDGANQEGGIGEYSSKIEAPTYTPKGDKPEIAALFDREKMDALLAQIDEAEGVSYAEKQFLTMAAARHLVFDYHQIAEFYCHASQQVQALMENSALVIIDFNKAIEQGYVQLSKRLAELYGETQSEDDDDEIGA